MTNRRMVRAGMALAAAFLTGCGIFGGGGGEPPAPAGGVQTVKAGEEETKLVFLGSETLNSCGGQAGNILIVRVYQLASETAFSAVPLTRLWDNEESELGKDLVGKAEFVLEPGGKQEIPLSSLKDAAFVAVVGNFCQAEGNCWRWISPWKKIRSDQKLVFGESCIESGR